MLPAKAGKFEAKMAQAARSPAGEVKTTGQRIRSFHLHIEIAYCAPQQHVFEMSVSSSYTKIRSAKLLCVNMCDAIGVLHPKKTTDIKMLSQQLDGSHSSCLSKPIHAHADRFSVEAAAL